jgi:hypothetical protein
LSSQPACRGAEKTKIPVDYIEHHGPCGDAADELGAATGSRMQMPGHGSIHQPHQRNGDVRQNAGQRQPQYFFVEGFHLTPGKEFGN